MVIRQARAKCVSGETYTFRNGKSDSNVTQSLGRLDTCKLGTGVLTLLVLNLIIGRTCVGRFGHLADPCKK